MPYPKTLSERPCLNMLNINRYQFLCGEATYKPIQRRLFLRKQSNMTQTVLLTVVIANETHVMQVEDLYSLHTLLLDGRGSSCRPDIDPMTMLESSALKVQGDCDSGDLETQRQWQQRTQTLEHAMILICSTSGASLDFLPLVAYFRKCFLEWRLPRSHLLKLSSFLQAHICVS